MMDELLYELIQVSLGTRDGLSRPPAPEEWACIFKAARQHSIAGVCFHGLSSIYDPDDSDTASAFNDENCSGLLPEDVYYDWMSMAFSIQSRSEQADKDCSALLKNLSSYGLQGSILKGQGMAALYGDMSSLRQSGDIDVYVNCGREKAMEYALSTGQRNVEWDIKHLHLNSVTRTPVELHYKVEILMDLVRNRKLQRWFDTPSVQASIFQEGVGRSNDIVSPSAEFNAFYILLHIYRHFLYEGVGLRQLMDYFYVLKNIDDEGTAERTRLLLKNFRMERFASAVMWIMSRVFGLDDRYLLMPPDEKEGRYVLGEVMKGGNFGHYDGRKRRISSGRVQSVLNVLQHNLHLLAHYPLDVVWAPVWIVYHWIWKKTRK